MSRERKYWLQQSRGGWYPIWFNSMFEFCQKMIHSIFNSILLHPRFNSKYHSIQRKFCWFNSKDNSIQYSGNHWYWSNRKSAKKESKIDTQKKGGFSSKMANNDSKFDSFIHFTIKFNSKNYWNSIFSGIINSKNYSLIFFAGKFNSKIDSKNLIWLNSIR